MPITPSTFKNAALACLAHNRLTADDVIKQLIPLKRSASLTFRGKDDDDDYIYHVLGQSVNFELWARRSNEPTDYEIAFYSDH